MNLNHLHLMVKDIRKSQQFYESMFGFKEKIWYGEGLLFMQNSEGFDLALSPTDNPVALPSGVHFGFSVNKKSRLQVIFAEGSELYPDCFKTPPKVYEGWGTLLCNDPDGYQFEIYWDENLRPTQD